MNISKQHIQHIAKLARIKLTEKQEKIFTEQLAMIFQYMEKLNKVDTMNVSPTSYVTGLSNITRDDIVKNSGISDELLHQLPDHSDRLLKVKAILEE